MNWHIGQRIVAVRSHSQGMFIEGNIYTIKGLKEPECKCNHIYIDIGVRVHGRYQCYNCDYMGAADSVWWFASICFRPLDDLSNHTADSLMEEMDLTIKIVEHEYKRKGNKRIPCKLQGV